MKKKVALVRIWTTPPIAASVERMLIESFPEYDVEAINLGRLIKRRPDILLINALYVLKEYGFSNLSPQRFKIFFWATTYIFHLIKALVSEQLAGRENDYAFSLQIGSLYDGSLPGIRHFVYTDHTMLANLLYPDFDRRDLYSPAWIELERTIYHNADMIFSWSSNITTSLIDQYDCPPEKVACVYSGANALPENHPLSDDRYPKKNILFVGVDWVRKGGPDLVEAFKIVLRTHPDARLTIVGCSPEISLPNCTVAGFAPLQEVHRYYEQASIFCLPTTCEPFGHVFIEAMAHRLPVVATDLGAIPDFVIEGENGYRVPSKDVNALAAALLNLVGDAEKCKSFGERGYQLVQERYNWKQVGSAIRVNILHKID